MTIANVDNSDSEFWQYRILTLGCISIRSVDTSGLHMHILVATTIVHLPNFGSGYVFLTPSPFLFSSPTTQFAQLLKLLKAIALPFLLQLLNPPPISYSQPTRLNRDLGSDWEEIYFWDYFGQTMHLYLAAQDLCVASQNFAHFPNLWALSQIFEHVFIISILHLLVVIKVPRLAQHIHND